MLLGNNEMSSWALLLLLLLTLISLIVRGSTSVPLVVHNSVWFVAIWLFGSGLIIYKEASFESWMQLFAGLLAFNLGAIFTQLFLKNRKNVSEVVNSTYQSFLVSRNGYIFLFILYIIGFATYLFVIASRFGLETLLTNPSAIRGYKGEVSYMESVPVWARVLLSVGPILFVLTLSPKGVGKPLKLGPKIVIAIFLTVTMLSLLQRTNLFISLLWLFSIYLITLDYRKIKLKRSNIIKVFVMTGVSVGLMFAVFQILAITLGKTQTDFYPAITKPLNDSGFAAIVSYSAGGTAAFLQLSESKNHSWPPESNSGEYVEGNFNPKTNGAALFVPILKVFPITKEWPQVAPFIDAGMPVNVFTWLEPWYRDFRSLGLIIGPALIGFLATITYAKRDKSIISLWFGSLLVAGIFFAPFTFKYYDTIFLVSGLIIFVAANTHKAHSSMQKLIIRLRAKNK